MFNLKQESKFEVNGDNCAVMSTDTDNSNRLVKHIEKQLEKGAEVFINPQTRNFSVAVKINGNSVMIPAETNLFSAIQFGNPQARGMRNILIDFINVDSNGEKTQMYCVVGAEPA